MLFWLYVAECSSISVRKSLELIKKKDGFKCCFFFFERHVAVLRLGTQS